MMLLQNWAKILEKYIFLLPWQPIFVENGYFCFFLSCRTLKTENILLFQLASLSRGHISTFSPHNDHIIEWNKVNI